MRQNLFNARRKAGLCYRCGAKKEAKFKTCAKCRAQRAKYARDGYIRRGGYKSRVKKEVPTTKPAHYYFDNPAVEALVIKYLDTGCTNIALRNDIMSNATELIRQVIMKNKFNSIVLGKSMDDLIQVAWLQIEKTLYKFDSSPGHTSLFNFWTQVSKTVLLAYIKREKRDSAQEGSLKEHIIGTWNGTSFNWERFVTEARAFWKYDDTAQKIIDGLETLVRTDERPFDGFIGKLQKITGFGRLPITKFMGNMKLLMYEFTDSPGNMVRERISENHDTDEDDDT